MLIDKEFADFHDGIFKLYFEKYIEFKRGKGEKVGHSTLIRLRTLNNELNLNCPSLEINRAITEDILREKSRRVRRPERYEYQTSGNLIPFYVDRE